MAGQKRQQVAPLLYLDLIYLMGLDDLDVGHRICQRFPQIRQRNGIANL